MGVGVGVRVVIGVGVGVGVGLRSRRRHKSRSGSGSRSSVAVSHRNGSGFYLESSLHWIYAFSGVNHSGNIDFKSSKPENVCPVSGTTHHWILAQKFQV